MAASSSRGRSSSPFHSRKPTSPYSSTSSSSSMINGRFLPRSCSSSATSFYGGVGGGAVGDGSRSMTPSWNGGDYAVGHTPVSFPAAEDQLVAEPMDEAPRSGDSISVTIRFRPMSDREYHRGDEIAWYADGDKIVRNEYNPMTAYAFDRVFGPDTNTEEVYEVAARPVVKAAMDGINGTVFAYGVTSSGKTHTMHGDQYSPGIIPLAIKDVFSIIQDTPGREFLLRVSYIEIYNEVINDLLDPTGQNLRVREDVQGTYVEGLKEEVVLSPGHALSFIAAGEEHRHVGSNNYNLFSSRSHTIFTLMIESSAHGDEYDGVIFSQLNLIDLAGSESSKTETTGLRRKEGSYINKSLLTLGTVIGKLSEGKASHVPFRDSKLTRLLQSSLSGHGHVSLICTITPASSNLEETHNTLKFASRAKHVEIYASRNRIIDEKSLIKKYQREISCLREELDQFKKGMLVGVNHEEILALRQQLEEGQVKMQSRLEEEEEAKAALMSRIQRLTKLILVSSKNTMPGNLDDVPSHQRSRSAYEEDDEVTMSDHMDLFVEQVKMLAGEIAFGTSTLKRLVEQSVDDPEIHKTQIQNLELEIQEKRRQMRVLEHRIVEGGEASVANASMVEMQQTISKLMAQCSEKGFELEIKSADNRVLQEQLQTKSTENRELQEKIMCLEEQLASVSGDRKPSLPEKDITDEYIDELRKKIQLQEIENEELKLEHVHIVEENSGLRVQNQKLLEEASYAKELASAAAIELKNLTGEVTKLSLQNAKLAKELQAAREFNSRVPGVLVGNGGARKHNDAQRSIGRRGRISGRANDAADVLDSWNLDPDDLKMELQARKQREAALEAALAERELLEDEYRRKFEESKKRETTLENDLANMWVLVARLKKEATAIQESKLNLMMQNEDADADADTPPIVSDVKVDCTDPPCDQADSTPPSIKETLNQEPASNTPKEEPLVVRLKARMQEIKEKELRYSGNNGSNDANSHMCKVCFESPAAAMLLPCRHFCLCKSCSLACAECPVCRTKIADRIFAFT
ncbi:kinesin-like protein KIN-7D, mitochondrial isoform X2 [Andrographis paniculata]|uniref:kinesin-like protein KIN-7D, mitochondrial isoform X2 n=1 Tax=Andrographis paniculata TaxID=175694 RepID=UPI0021E73EC0|nr:kinesin-like protein KIN-7D, mitochondrial isoform X2 [Andrographis paniculata]